MKINQTNVILLYLLYASYNCKCVQDNKSNTGNSITKQVRYNLMPCPKNRLKPAVLHRVLKFTEFIILFAVKFRNIHRGYARFVFFVSCIHKGMKMLQLQHLFPRKIIFLRNFSVKSLWTEQWSNVIKLRKVEST